MEYLTTATCMFIFAIVASICIVLSLVDLMPPAED